MPRRGAPRTLSHPLLKALDSRGLTVATVFGARRGQAYDWISGRRPVPRRYAEWLECAYGVPMSSWRRITD